jgi:hypothetical protein
MSARPQLKWSNVILPGTAGKLAGWDSSGNAVEAEGQLYREKVSLTAAQIRTMSSTPVTIVAAPGANKIIQVQFMRYKQTYGTVQFDFPNPADGWGLKLGAQVANNASPTLAVLNLASNVSYSLGSLLVTGTALSNIDNYINQALVFTKTSGSVGDATVGDSTGEWIVYYRIIDLS